MNPRRLLGALLILPVLLVPCGWVILYVGDRFQSDLAVIAAIFGGAAVVVGIFHVIARL